VKASKVSQYLVVYGFSHAIVDASCIILILGGIDVKADLMTYILLYNMLAFGLQLPFGWIIDKIQKPSFSAIVGCILIALALFLFLNPILATILAGIGNALFHVGGGTVALNLRPGKASMPGVFVAPGGIGLFAGGLLVKIYGFKPEVFIALLLIMALFLFLLKSPPILYKKVSPTSTNFMLLIIILLLLTICIRSAIGLSIDFAWKSNMKLMILLITCIALGKGLGGFLADYFGWIKTTVPGLAFSAILLFLGQKTPVIGLAGMFLFNITMPVTLVAISNLLPGRPGFSFGLTTLALVIGSLITYSNYKSLLTNNTNILILTLLSALILFAGLNLYYKRKNIAVPFSDE
jgi:MFS transporter, FSR family, fosmidomycin resistance protein